MRARPSIVAVAIGTVIAALAAGDAGVHAEAESTDNGFAKRLFAGDPGKQAKSYACFVRLYDAAHLARHPLQKVSVMKLLITAEKAAEDEVLNYSFRLGLAFRNRPGNFDSSGDCGHVKETSPPDNKGTARLLGRLRGGRHQRGACRGQQIDQDPARHHPHLAQQQAR